MLKLDNLQFGQVVGPAKAAEAKATDRIITRARVTKNLRFMVVPPHFLLLPAIVMTLLIRYPFILFPPLLKALPRPHLRIINYLHNIHRVRHSPNAKGQGIGLYHSVFF